MAKKKRLNKKLISVIVLISIPLLVVVWYGASARRPGLMPAALHSLLGRDSQELLEQGRVALEEAIALEEQNREKIASYEKEDPEKAFTELEELNEETAEEKWRVARKCLWDARKFVGGDIELRQEILDALSKLSLRTHDYDTAQKIWRIQVQLEGGNVDAHRRMIDYIHEMTRLNGSAERWTRLEEEAQSYIELNPDDPYGYAVKAHARQSLLVSGALDDSEQAEAEVRELLEKVLRLDEKHILAYRLKAELALWKTQQVEEEQYEGLYQEAERLLQAAIDMHPDSIAVYRNYFEVYLRPMLMYQRVRMQQAGDETEKAKQQAEYNDFYAEAVEKVDSWIASKPEEGEFYAMKGRLLRVQLTGIDLELLGRIIDLYQEAIAREPHHVEWQADLAQMYVTRASQRREPGDDFRKAFRLLHYLKYLPEAQIERAGSRSEQMHVLRYGRVLPFLIHTSLELYHLTEAEGRKDEFLAIAETNVQEIQEKLREQELPFVKLAVAKVKLARGEKEEGIKTLYEAAEQIEVQPVASSIANQIYWTLFETLRDTEHKMLAYQYAAKAFQQTPHPTWHYVDIVEILAELPGRRSKMSLVEFVEKYRDQLRENQDDYQDVLVYEAEAMLQLGRTEEALEVMSRITIENERVDLLRARTQDTTETRVEAMEALFEKNPGDSDLATGLFDYYYQKSRDDEAYLEKAQALIDKAIAADPENIDLIRKRVLLNEGGSGQLTEEQQMTLAEEIIGNLSDPYRRACERGKLYYSMAQRETNRDDSEQAAAYLQKAKSHYEEAAGMKENDLEAVRGRFNVAMQLENWQEAEQIWTKLKAIDPVKSQYFQAQMFIKQDKMSEAAQKLESYVEQRPLDQEAQLLLAQVYYDLGQQQQSLNQLLKAVKLDPTDLAANRLLCTLRHSQNTSKGLDNLTSADIDNVLSPLRSILDIYPYDLMANRLLVTYRMIQLSNVRNRLENETFSQRGREQLESVLTELFESTAPRCRYLVESDPENAVVRQVMAQLYQNYALALEDPAERQKWIAEAEKVFQEALQRFPDSVELQAKYGAFQRETGQGGSEEKVLKDFIAKAEGERKYEAMLRLSQHYMTNDRIQEAGDLLIELLQEDGDNVTAGTMLANLYILTNQYEKALDLFEQLYELQKKAEFLAGQVSILIEMGREDEAEPKLETLQTEHGGYEGMRMLLARLALRKNKFAEAIAYTEQVLADDPQDLMALQIKARAQYLMEDFSAAMNTLERLRQQVDPDNNTGRLLMSQINWNRGFYNDAVTVLEQAVKADPGDRRCRAALIARYKDLNRWSDLDLLYRNLIEQNPEDIGLLVEAGKNAMTLADEYKKRNNDVVSGTYFTKASDYMQQAMTLSREKKQGLYVALDGMLSLMRKAGNYDEMIQLVDRYQNEENPNLNLMLHKAEATYLKGRQSGQSALEEQALAQFERILETFEGKADLNQLILTYSSRLGRPDRMIAWARKQLEQQPGQAIMHVVVAQMYGVKGQWQQQVAELKKVIEEGSEKMARFGMNQISLILLVQEQWEEAIVYLRQLIEKYPNEASYLNNLAYALMQQDRNIDEAITIAEKAFNLQRTDSDIMDTYAMALLKGKDYEKAELIAMRAIQEKRRSGDQAPPEYQYHLSQALIGQGRTDEALEVLRREKQKIEAQADSQDNDWLERITELMQSVSGTNISS